MGERARVTGMNMGELANRVRSSSDRMSDVARALKNVNQQLQARVASTLEALVKVEPAGVSPYSRWERVGATE